jgi:hypothetical protein
MNVLWSPHQITCLLLGLFIELHVFLGLLIKSHIFPSFLITCFFSGLSHRIICRYLGILIKSQVSPGFLIKSHLYSVVPHKIAYMHCSAWSPHQTTCLFPGLLTEPHVFSLASSNNMPVPGLLINSKVCSLASSSTHVFPWYPH